MPKQATRPPHPPRTPARGVHARSPQRAHQPHAPAPPKGMRRHAYKLALLVLVITSLLPLRLLSWAGWFRGLTTTLAAPISHPITLMGAAVRPPERTRDQRTLDQLVRELETERLARLQAEARNARLLEQLAVLRFGAALNPDVPVRQLPAPVVGESAGVPLVATGSREGIEDGDVATTAGVQLMGRAAQTSARTTRVVPITHRDAPPIAAAVILDDAASRARRCLLSPTGDGTLTGDLETDDPDNPAPVEAGMTVRLFDDAWPPHAQMLIVGRITRVAQNPSSPLRQTITVKPLIELARVDEVVFRLPVTTDAEEARP